MNKLFFSSAISMIIAIGLACTIQAPVAYAAEITYTLSETWNGYGTDNGYFNFPVDVFVDVDERVLVADYSNNRIQVFGQNAQVLSVWTGFKNPEKIAQGKDGNFYVADTNNHRIVKLNKNGLFLSEWSGINRSNFFPRGVGVAVSPDNYIYSVHAVDYIEKFDSEGNPVLSWGTSGVLMVPGTLEAVRVDSQGYVYVIANDSVMKFTSQGILLAKWGSFNGAQDLFIDQNDNIFITNTYKNRIEKYTKDGQLLTMFGEGILNVPHGAGVDRRGRVYVADARNHRVVVFTPSAPPPFILNVPLIKQTDLQWKDVSYDHASVQNLNCGKTIADCGCALTSLAMILNFHGVTKSPEGKPTNPATLNEYFNKNTQCVSSGCVSQGYAFGNVIWNAADRYSAEAFKKFGTQKIVSFNDAPSTLWDNKLVADDIKNNQPVIARVQKNEHWAVITGTDQDTFVINDPRNDVNRLNQKPYLNTAYNIRRFKKTSSDFSSLEFTTKYPGTIEVTDPKGRINVGIPNTNVSSSILSSSNNTVTIGTPLEGEYRVVLSSSTSTVPLAVHASDSVGSVKIKVFEQTNPYMESVRYEYKFIYNPHPAHDQLKLGVTIDIEPHVKHNVGFCENSSLMIPVAVLGTSTINIDDINDESVVFGNARNLLKNPISGKAFHLKQDVNRDGISDAVFNFMFKDAQLSCTTTKGVIKGALKDGMSFEGVDDIYMMTKAKPGK